MDENRKKTIRKKADFYRGSMRISNYGIMNLFKECERMGLKLIRYPLGENADLGFAIKKDDDVVIFTNSSVRLSREIFTLAHEMGHAFLHMSGLDSFVDNSSTLSDYSADEKEQEANYFAACLLMPEDKVKSFLDLELNEEHEDGLKAIDIAKIMSEFNVSFEMVLNRLESISVIDSVGKAKLDNEKNEKRVRNLLQSVGGNALLNEPSNLLGIPSEYMEYVIYNYNHGAIPKGTLERVLNYYRLLVDDISDKIYENHDDDLSLDTLIGGLKD